MGYIFLIAIMLALSIGASQKGCGIKCFSFSCRYNRSGKCGRKEITVYDNTVKGLCLHHTESMKERILDPMQEKRMITSAGDSEFGKKMIDKIMKMQEEKLLKDPDTFDKWMNNVEAMELLIEKLSKTKNNEEFLNSMNQK